LFIQKWAITTSRKKIHQKVVSKADVKVRPDTARKGFREAV